MAEDIQKEHWNVEGGGEVEFLKWLKQWKFGFHSAVATALLGGVSLYIRC